MARPDPGIADKKFGEAVGALQQGRTDLAERLCREILNVQPRHADALHVIGILAVQRGEHSKGIDALRKSVAINPNQPVVLCNLGNALRDAKQAEAALEYYNRALLLLPAFAGALYNQGNALLDMNRAPEALESFDRALALEPDNADAHNNRGKTLLVLGRPNDALEAYRRAVSLRSGFTLALDNLSRVLRELKRPQEALAVCDRLLALQPDDAEALTSRGTLLLELERAGEALESFDRALPRHQDPALARFNRGYALFGLQRFDEALANFDAALRISPDLVEALLGRGGVLRAMRRYEDALADFERAARLRPESADVLYRLGGSLRDLYRHEAAASVFAQVLARDPKYPNALGNLMHSRLQTCDWTDHALNKRRMAEALQAGKRMALPGLYLSVTDSAREQFECTRIFVAHQHGAAPAAIWRGEKYRHRRIRVAYVSADFREHPVAQLLAGILERHDRERFEVFGISLKPEQASPLGRRVKSAFARFIVVADKNDREIAEFVRELEIDIAIDLMGYTGSGREGIFAHRPAPVQVNYLGYTATMGMPQIDYIIADSVVIPSSDEIYFTEKVVHLPVCYLPPDSARVAASETPTRAECGLPEDGIVFCCFNTVYKITPPVFDIWMRLLRAVPNSVLWLAEGPDAAARNLRREAGLRDVEPQRLVFAPRIPEPEKHLARYRLADLFLDTVPFNAHATASDALSTGLPILTCRGGTFAGRVASSLLTAMGIPELIASDLAEYEQLALRFAASPSLLTGLRARLLGARTSAALFDTARYCSALETAYESMWRRAEQGESAQGFAVAARNSDSEADTVR
jgi:protein O-GlcNAc transferase